MGVHTNLVVDTYQVTHSSLVQMHMDLVNLFPQSPKNRPMMQWTGEHTVRAKGQLISGCIFGVFKSPKKTTKF